MTLFDVDSPIIAAPMAGGPTIPSLVLAAARAGAFGFLAGGYKTAAALESEIAEVRAASIPFGVNLFAPSPVTVDPAAFDDYRDALREAAARFGVDLGGAPPRDDDDEFGAKIALLLEDPVPMVSFTFGIPPVDTIRRLRGPGRSSCRRSRRWRRLRPRSARASMCSPCKPRRRVGTGAP